MGSMDNAELEETLFAISDAKLHGESCKLLSNVYCKVLTIFPVLEAARPSSRSGIQSLCSLHIALERARGLLQHCSECSKLYLAITGDSVVLKFEKAKCMLIDSLRRVEDIVPQSIASQAQDILSELEGTVFSLDPLVKQVGDDIIALLQQGKKFDENSNDSSELETFHQAALKLGITSSRAALTERRALKKLIEKAQAEEDKRKESIVAYLLHLMRKYSKLFRSDLGDDQESQGSAPCSPTVHGSSEESGILSSNGKAFDGHFSKISSFNFKPSLAFKPNDRRSDHIPPIPPEELRCPISLQVMYDPVIIASGQTYERVCIEKWLSDGHNTCPKTQQHLCHLSLTPNYCVKGLIGSWCEQNGVPIPDGPPESLDLNYWRLALSDSDSPQLKSIDNSYSGKSKEAKVVPLESNVTEEDAAVQSCSMKQEESDYDEMYNNFLSVLEGEGDLSEKREVVEQIRWLVKDDEEVRVVMGAHGFVEALVRFLRSAIDDKNDDTMEVGAMALFNLAVNNNRNKEVMMGARVIPMVEEMTRHHSSYALAAALYLNLSCLDEAKPVLGSSQAVSFLVSLLRQKTDPQSKIDSLHALFNLSTYQPNIPNLLQSGILNILDDLLSEPRDQTWTEKSIAVLLNLASDSRAKEEIPSSTSLIGSLATILDTGECMEQEQSVSCLLTLCNGNEKCSQMVLQEGVIPSLVSIQVNGSTRGRDKAQKLLMLFREQRQRVRSPQKANRSPSVNQFGGEAGEVKPLSKSNSVGQMSSLVEGKPNGRNQSRRIIGKTFSFFRKTKNFSGPQ